LIRLIVAIRRDCDCAITIGCRSKSVAATKCCGITLQDFPASGNTPDGNPTALNQFFCRDIAHVLFSVQAIARQNANAVKTRT